jgi:hypothetical protein
METSNAQLACTRAMHLLHLHDVPAPSSRLRATRKVMADEARTSARANDTEL